MRAARLLLALLLAGLGASLGLVAAAPAATRNVTLEFSQDTLNRIVARLGTPSAHGVHSASAGLVPWTWAVTRPRFVLAAGRMSFSATVETRVGTALAQVTRTVPAMVRFDPALGRLRVLVAPFTVPLTSDGAVITQVDVARLYGISVPVEPQEIAVPLLDGEARELALRVQAASADYFPGRVVVTVDLGVSAVAATGATVRSARPFAPPLPDGGPLAATGRGTLRVYESLLNEVANQVEPMRLHGHYSFKRGCGCVPGIGCACAVDVSCEWTARVTDVRFDIKPSGIAVRGDVRASWCNLSFDAVASTSADVSYVHTLQVSPRAGLGRAREDYVRVRTSSTNVQPVFRIQGYEAKLPIRINVGPSMSWRVPVSTGFFHFETADGPQRIRISPSDMSVIKRSGYLELQANVNLW